MCWTRARPPSGARESVSVIVPNGWRCVPCATESRNVRDDGAVVLHLEDGCGEHFMQGYWPAVRFDDDGDVVEVTVEA